LIRSEPPRPVELDDSLSLPYPGSLPMPVSTSIDGMLGISAGRATGRAPPSGLAALARGVLVRAAGFGFAAALGAAFRFVLLAALVLFFAVVRFAGAFFLPPERELVARFAVVRLAVDFLAVDRFLVERLLVDFFADFFFAAIDPPFGCAMSHRAR
jgi:hypothetical protein